MGQRKAMGREAHAWVSAVKEFHLAVGRRPAKTPNMRSRTRRRFWRNLIAEEVGELLVALDESEIVNVADGAADSLYVIIGAALDFGIPLNAIFSEVHASNMSKTLGGSSRGKNGKVIRGRGFRPPNIKKCLREAS